VGSGIDPTDRHAAAEIAGHLVQGDGEWGLRRSGDELTEALAQTDLFPEEYLQMLQVAETSGTIPETLQRLSPEFEDQARRSLSTLATVASYGVWLMVAGCIVFVIFRIALWYVGMLQGAVNDALR
jgi:type IV pilus assembly protein PilC